MFSRVSPRHRNRQNNQFSSPSSKPFDDKKYEDPLQELSQQLDRLELLLEKTKNEFFDAIRPPSNDNKKRGIVESFRKLRQKPKQEDYTAPTITLTPRKAAAVSPLKSPNNRNDDNHRRVDFTAKFVPMKPAEELELVEILRRVAELVVIGERAAATCENRKEKLRTLEESQNWGDDITSEEATSLNVKTPDQEQQKYIALFEHFFERNGLSLIVNIVTGSFFAIPPDMMSPPGGDTDGQSTVDSNDSASYLHAGTEIYPEDCIMLPPLAIAVQAVQSVSILVQNVSRATSLYFILSNNHINQLIDFPLECYHFAERTKHLKKGTNISSGRFASPELAELTTHFVTFLKSLALRMNAETLQFYLTYPNEGADGNATASPSHFSSGKPVEYQEDDDDLLDESQAPMDEIQYTKAMKQSSLDEDDNESQNRPVMVKQVRVRFPLYARALEFCAAHQDSFIRVTAMNICLNTLRLATVSPSAQTEEDDLLGNNFGGSSPDGVLHNAKPLPLRERLAIAQHVCAPARVERLVSPIFTKLAQLWGMLEETFRDVDKMKTTGTSTETGATGSSSSNGGNKKKKSSSDTPPRPQANSKVAKAKETAKRQKLTDTFNDIADTFQDELLLLEDVLKVGLTSLNEQTIEMMFATFVYPLLLQPLLLYFQRSPIPEEILFADPLNDHSAGRDIQIADTSSGDPSLLSAPAKSAIFSATAVFQFVTNKPLLRLLFTSLFHPLSPDSTGETMIRAKADVACFGANGKVNIRVDKINDKGQIVTKDDRSTYLFGTVTGNRCQSNDKSSDSVETEDDCVFVLSPALAEVLEYRGEDISFIARTRHNPYRKAMFRCLTISDKLSDLRRLSVLCIDSAVSVFPEQFVSQIILGLDLKKFKDDMPVDERKSDSKWAYALDDRGIGGSTPMESRMTLGAPTGGTVGFDYMNEVLLSFRRALMTVAAGPNEVWELDYDLVAAHAILRIVQASPAALMSATKGIDRRCRQSATFLADMPALLEQSVGYASTTLFKRTKEEAPDYREEQRGMIMDSMFYSCGKRRPEAVIEGFLELKRLARPNERVGHSVTISKQGSYKELCDRACSFPPSKHDTESVGMDSAMLSASCWLKIDALTRFIGDMAASNGEKLRGRVLGGFAASNHGTFDDAHDGQFIYSTISPGFWSVLFEPVSTDSLTAGTIVSMVGHIAIPCVCEVPPSCAPLFSREGAKIVSEGITWQSLYLVVIGDQLLLTEPEGGTRGDGRIVTCCRLDELSVEKDATKNPSSSARRLIVLHESLNMSDLPGLFAFDEDQCDNFPPKVKEIGPFYYVKKWHSCLDVWFEDDAALQHAFDVVSSRILQSKAVRGNRLRKYLAQGDGSSYSMDAPM